MVVIIHSSKIKRGLYHSLSSICVIFFLIDSLYFLPLQDKRTPLHLASLHGRTAACRLLLDCRAEPGTTDQVSSVLTNNGFSISNTRIGRQPNGLGPSYLFQPVTQKLLTLILTESVTGEALGMFPFESHR